MRRLSPSGPDVMTGDRPEASGFAIGNDEQYRPVQVAADQPVRIGGTSGLLMCHASRGLGDPPRTDGPLAARLSGADPLIVAPQFLAEVDTRARGGIPGGA